MKRKTKSKKFDHAAYLKEIELVLPTQQDPNRRDSMITARDFILGNFPERTPQQIISNLLFLPDVIHSLQCCGVSPKGCPPPIKPHKDDRIIMVPIIELEGFGKNGGVQ